MALLISEITNAHPGFWTPKRRELLDIIIDHFPNGGAIKLKELKPLYEELTGRLNATPIKSDLSRLRNVLGKLNEMGLTKAELPAERIPLPAPSVLPRKGEEFSQLPIIESMREFLWDDWLARPFTEENSLLAYALCMSTDMGIGYKTTHWILQNLRWSHLGHDSRFQIPLLADKPDRGLVSLFHNSCNELLLNTLKERMKPNNNDQNEYVFSPQTAGEKTRKNLFKKLTLAIYDRFCADYLQKYPCENPPSLAEYFNVGRLLPVLNAGLEPFIITVASNMPLSVTQNFHHDNALLRADLGIDADEKDQTISQSAITHIRRTTYQSSKSGDATDVDDRYANWCSDARDILIQFYTELNKLPKKEITDKKSINNLHTELDKLLVKADEIAPDKSALHLALNWTKSLVSLINTSKNPKPNTLKTHISRAFGARLLRHKDSYDLSTWDSVDHEEVLEDYFEDEKIDASTLEQLSKLFGRIYRFGKQHNYCDDVDVRFIAKEVSYGSRRTKLIDPSDFDSFINELDNSSEREREMMSGVSAMGYYGGARASDIARATLDNVVFDHRDCYIEIHKGKTAAARRRIFLSLLAPPEYVELIKSLWKRRRQEFGPSARLDSIHLFGPEGKREAYKRSSLLDGLITRLKSRFGSDMVYHSLRHSFASWLLLRWYGLRHPKVFEQLYDKYHPIFGDESQQRLRQLFALRQDGELDFSRPNDLVIISKLMGHLGQLTLFNKYIHTFHIIQKEAMERVAAHDNRKLSGKVIASLIPKMKSRVTQRKLKDRTVTGLVEYLREEAN